MRRVNKISIFIVGIINAKLSKMKSKKGFTLVELLIVVAIIAILAAIAIPQFNIYSTKAKLTTLRSDLKHAYLAAQGYLIEKEYAIVNNEDSLIKHGFKRTNGISIVNISIGLQTGSITLSHSGLDISIVNSKEGKVSYDGKITLPLFN